MTNLPIKGEKMEDKELSGEEKLNKLVHENESSILVAQNELSIRESSRKLMRLRDVEKSINEINNFLSKRTWMDFTYKKIDEESISLIGCIDLTDIKPEIEITFSYPQVIASPFFWTMDNNQMFIKLSSIEELKEVTGLYAYDDVYVFKLSDEQLEGKSAIFITATGVQCNILK